MKTPKLTCDRCGLEDTLMVDAPRLDDPRVYCIDCYAILFPPGWTDEYQPLSDPPMENNCDHFVVGDMCIKCGYRWATK